MNLSRNQNDELHLQQGSAEWRAFRKTKITATDAPVIMGDNPWTSVKALMKKKISDSEDFLNAKMQRGLDLEPEARELFAIQTGIETWPKVLVRDWQMASLDGISECGKYIVEIKCPSETFHKMAELGKIPKHYFAQLQHQMYVADVDMMYYYSYDGFDGTTIEVKRNDEYIKTMLEKELEFYNKLKEIIDEA